VGALRRRCRTGAGGSGGADTMGTLDGWLEDGMPGADAEAAYVTGPTVGRIAVEDETG
jgi:hypothetical protein